MATAPTKPRPMPAAAKPAPAKPVAAPAAANPAEAAPAQPITDLNPNPRPAVDLPAVDPSLPPEAQDSDQIDTRDPTGTAGQIAQGGGPEDQGLTFSGEPARGEPGDEPKDQGDAQLLSLEDAEALNDGNERMTKPLGQVAASADPAAPPQVPQNVNTVPANAVPPRLSPAAAFPNEETITMISPREFKVQYAPGQFAHFKKGPQEVPTSLQDHKYVRDNGVKPYER